MEVILEAKVGSRTFKGSGERLKEEVLDIDITLDNSIEGNKFFEKLSKMGPNKILGLRLRVMSSSNHCLYMETVVKRWGMTPFKR